MKDGDTLTLRTPAGQTLKTELALSDDKKRDGFQFRDRPRAKTGLFFLNTDMPHRRSMWMPNMRFPLDIVWLDGSLTIVSIRKDVQPCPNLDTCPNVSSIYKAQHAIELGAGDADALGLKPGMTLKVISVKGK
jgi:uncharacterized membrane protein (UPF0127 family)